MTEYRWDFSELKTIPAVGGLRDAVASVSYRLAAVGEQGAVYRYGLIQFPPPKKAAFVPFEQISEERFITFAEQALGDSLAAMKAEMQQELNAPAVEDRAFPWLPEPVSDSDPAYDEQVAV